MDHESTQSVSGVSRRGLVRGAGGAALVGAALLTAGPASAEAEATGGNDVANAADTALPNGTTAASGPLVVHLIDARTGEMDFYHGSAHTRVRDRDLAARLAAAAR